MEDYSGDKMRLHFTLSPNTELVPYDYQHQLTGRFHAWLSDNDIHDTISLYSLSWLHGGKRDGNGLVFPNGATWFISAHDHMMLHKVCLSATKEVEICYGMKVVEIKILPPPRMNNSSHCFRVASPVLARGKEIEGKVRHYLFSDEEADAILTQALRHKLDKAGLSHLAAETYVRFERSYPKACTKLVTINGIANRASICPVTIEGPPEAVEFAWNVGIGHLTGSGFGALI
jgi:CRISPR-associated endoribonuclease Cas6